MIVDNIRSRLEEDTMPRSHETDTPRVDRFIAEHPLRLPEHLKTDVNAVIPMRQWMIDWAEFARELEREIQHSVPKEWNIPPHRK